MNSVGDGSQQRVRRVSLERATVSPAPEKCRPVPLRQRTDTEVIDFFAPPRDDFVLGGKPAYMSEG
jgi:hypothetical protein